MSFDPTYNEANIKSIDELDLQFKRIFGPAETYIPPNQQGQGQEQIIDKQIFQFQSFPSFQGTSNKKTIFLIAATVALIYFWNKK